MADAPSSALVDELHALRSALHRAQTGAHSTSLKLHASSLQHTLTLDQLRSAEASQAQLLAELAVLRSNPVRPDEAVALEEKLQALSLAHRRLSALADGADAAVKRETDRRVNEQAYRARAEMRLAKALEQLPTSPPPVPPKDGRELPDGEEAAAQRTPLLAGEKEPQPTAAKSQNGQGVTVEQELEIERAAASETRDRLIAVEVELDRRRRDDAAAASVVERYMSFSQSSSLLLHGQLHALRTRHDASLATLLQENDKLRRELGKERKEAERTRARLGQVGEEAWIEAEGRRREIGLRLASVAREERLMDNLRRWNTRVQAVVSQLADSDVAGDFSSAMSTTDVYATLMPVLGQASNILELDSKEPKTVTERPIPSAQASRVYMAEELLASTMDDLRLEQKRRRDLETRLAELEGAAASTEEALAEELLPDPEPTLGQAPLSLFQPTASPSEPAALPEAAVEDPLLASLLALPSQHQQLRARYSDLNVALTTLLATPSPSSDELPVELSALLVRAMTRLSDVLEDGRVELEIAIDDERRAVESFHVLLALGHEGQTTKANELVRREVEDYIVTQERGIGSAMAAGLRKRADDLEWDFAALKAVWINPDSLLSSPLPQVASLVTSPVVSPVTTRASTQHLFPTQQFLLPPPLPGSGSATPHNPLSKLGLRTLQGLIPPTPSVQLPPTQNGGFRRSSFANIGRLFREQGPPPPGPARSFSMQSTTSNGSTDGGGGGWGMYRHPGLNGSALGLASPVEASGPAVGLEEDEDDEVE